MDRNKEQQIYQYIADYIMEHLYAPTIREICKNVGLRSTSSVVTYLIRLESKGLIKVESDSPRAIRLMGYSIVPNSVIEELEQLRAEKADIQ